MNGGWYIDSRETNPDHYTIHEVVSHNTRELMVIGCNDFPVRSPGISKTVIVVVESTESVSDSVVQVRDGPVDRVAVSIGRNSVCIHSEGSLLRVRHAMGWSHPVGLDKPLDYWLCERERERFFGEQSWLWHRIALHGLG